VALQVFVQLEIPLPNECHRWHEGDCKKVDTGSNAWVKCSPEECQIEEECLWKNLRLPSVGEDFNAEPFESFWCRKLKQGEAGDDKNGIGI
jgi:hypothetical protein